MLIEPNSPQQLIELPIRQLIACWPLCSRCCSDLVRSLRALECFPVPSDRVRILALACGFFNAGAPQSPQGDLNNPEKLRGRAQKSKAIGGLHVRPSDGRRPATDPAKPAVQRKHIS